MKKKLLAIFLILIILSGSGVIYLNRVILPQKIKSLVIQGIEESTQKKVTLEGLQFNIFKGLVLKDLVLYDESGPLLRLKEGACTFLILPIFKKQVIIPSLRLDSPVIFLKRRKDLTFNLQDIWAGKKAPAAKPKFSLLIYSVRVIDGRIDFRDEALSPVFSKTIDNLHLSLHLSLPNRIKFKFRAQMPSQQTATIDASGEYRLSKGELLAKVFLRDFSPQDFTAYYQGAGISILAGKTDALLNLDLKDGILNAEIKGENKGFIISQGKIKAALDAHIETGMRYNLKDKQLAYSGKALLTQASISGLELVGEISGITGEWKFDNSGISADRLNASVLGLPIEAKIRLTELNQPLLDISVTSVFSLGSLQKILKDKFKFALPAEITGDGKLSASIQTRLPASGLPDILGYLDVRGGTIKSEKLGLPVKDISGRFEFTSAQVKWAGVDFRYDDLPYKTTGSLTDFIHPLVQLGLSSERLSLESGFAFKDKLITISQFKGRYLNSDFSLQGKIDNTVVSQWNADIDAKLDLDLKDLKEPLDKFKERLERIRPDGMMHVQGTLKGDVRDLKSCAIEAVLSSPSLSAWGLRAEGFALNFNQAGGLIDIPMMHMSVYDGTLEASAKMNLNTEHLPYWVNLNIQGVRLEKLKQDAGLKEKDIAGTIQAEAKINGFSNDLTKLNGIGKLSITQGKLWQLDLFKGPGFLLFSKDFANIVFSEGSCGFIIQDRGVFTDNLKLESNLAELAGSVRIGFDSSVDASINVRVNEEMAPATNTLKDLTTAIIGQAGRFGVIRITGTLRQPKYKFQPAVADIMKSLKDSILENIRPR